MDTFTALQFRVSLVIIITQKQKHETYTSFAFSAFRLIFTKFNSYFLKISCAISALVRYKAKHTIPNAKI